jgi:hypothetical protein
VARREIFTRKDTRKMVTEAQYFDANTLYSMVIDEER